MEFLKNPQEWFTEVYIHENSWDSSVGIRIRNLFQERAIRVSENPYAQSRGLLSGKDFNASKRRLYLSPHLGHFFKACPGRNQSAACCNLYVLNLGVQCPMNCTYCYLQSFINSPITQIYSNIEDAFRELDGIVKESPTKPFRVCTGETIDSLALDDLTHYSLDLVRWFKQNPHLNCEFKTKSNNIKNFVNEPHGGNVVVSFSVNPQEIVSSEEFDTASLEERLMAARECADRGFPVAFHIDPMIYTENWQELYSQMVNRITTLFTPSEIKWTSIGALRYPPEMKNILRERFGKTTRTLTGELFISKDGKLRYDQNLRNIMFKGVLESFHKADPTYKVMLCMETPESWLGSFQKTPRQISQISELFVPL